MHERRGAEEVAGDRHAAAPEGAADDVERQIHRIAHVGHSGHHRRERSHEGHEPGQDDGHRPVLLEEGVRLGHVVLFEEPGVFLFEQRRPDPAPDEIPGLVTEDGDDGDGRRQDPNVERALRGQQSAGEQQRLTRKQREQQPSLHEDDDEDGR